MTDKPAFFQSQWIAPIPLNFFLHEIRPVARPWCCQEDPSIWFESALRESLFHQNLQLGLRLMRAVGLSWGETCPSLLTRVSWLGGWGFCFSLPAPPPGGELCDWSCAGLGFFWCVSDLFLGTHLLSRHYHPVPKGSLEHSLLFSYSDSFSAGHNEAVFRLPYYLEAPKFSYLLSYYKHG